MFGTLGAEPAGLVFVLGIGGQVIENNDIGHVLQVCQPCKDTIKPLFMSGLPVTNSGKYGCAVLRLAAYKNTRVISCCMANNRADSWF
ncbi:hypothetical protein D3C87_1739830 [compost metagenome]